MRRITRRTAGVLAALTVAALTPSVAGALAGGAVAGAAVPVALNPAGSVVVTMRGNGHGHGLSQYGARGAALQGRSAATILAFYYPGTTRTVLAPSQVRVRLGGTGSVLTVQAQSRLLVTGVTGYLPSVGIARWRLLAAGSGFTLQQLRSAAGSAWTTYRTGLPDRAEFRQAYGWSVRVYTADGGSTTFLGALRAVRSGGSSYVVNRVSLDQYTAGVVPREMPASWPAQAVQAQAVAARTYGRYAVEHAAAGSEYDICDTTQCQVYGGHYRFSASGAQLWSDDLPAATATANTVLRYRGATVFSQFAASNGGWSTDGGQPYLVAKSDPYDAAVSGDPYLGYTQTVPVRSIASWFGLARVTSVLVVTRDGRGTWGGRVLTARVVGTDSAGKARTVSTTGFGLQGALGVGTTWLSLRAA